MDAKVVSENLMTIILCIVCTLFGIYQLNKSRKHAEELDMDNGAQNVVTVGVLCTFLGIAVALWNFDPEDISTSIPVFLDSMKAAFFTSIIGMGFGLYIKAFVQSEVEQKREKIFMDTFRSFTNTESVEEVRKRQEEYAKRMEEAGKNLSDVMSLFSLFSQHVVPQMEEQFKRCSVIQDTIKQNAELLNVTVENTTKALEGLRTSTKQLASLYDAIEKSSKNYNAAINTMGSAMNTTAERAATNYKNLMDKIAELDRFMIAHGGTRR